MPKGIIEPTFTVDERRRIIEDAAARLVVSLTRLHRALGRHEPSRLVAAQVAQCQLEAAAVQDRLGLLMVLVLNEE